MDVVLLSTGISHALLYQGKDNLMTKCLLNTCMCVQCITCTDFSVICSKLWWPPTNDR